MKVIGMRTRAGVPGLKRQRRKAETVELSKIGLPMLCSIMASTANPLLESMLITATPLPVIWRLRASYGYSGRGALSANAFAFPTAASRVCPDGRMGAGVRRAITAGFCSVSTKSAVGNGGGVGTEMSGSGGVGGGSSAISTPICGNSVAAGGIAVESWRNAIATADK